MAKMPLYDTIHDLEVASLRRIYEKRGYIAITDVSQKHFRHIPDLLLVSPEKRVLWIEVETNATERRRKRKQNKLKQIREALSQVGGQIRIFGVDEE